ncbi:MAG: ABC transporter substrate-binding protein, partial [Thermoplasmata archaeon]
GILTVFYDFDGARFHDGTPVSVWDVLFSYHALALHPLANGPLRVLMHLNGKSGSNFTMSRWLSVLPVDDGDGNASTASLRFARQFSVGFVNFATLTLGIPVLPMHVWSRTGTGRHTDFGCAIWIPPSEAAARGIPECGNTDASRWGVGIAPSEAVQDSVPFDLTAAMSWVPWDAHVIGSGHFRFDVWLPGTETRLLANADYAFGAPRVDGVRFLVYKTSQLLVFALQSGTIDVILGSVNAEFHADLRNTPGIALLEVEDVYPSALYFNLRNQPFGFGGGDVVRRAIAHLVDRTAVVSNLLQGHGRVADAMVSPANGAWHNASVPTYPFDLLTASAILDSPEAQSVGIGLDPP